MSDAQAYLDWCEGYRVLPSSDLQAAFYAGLKHGRGEAGDKGEIVNCSKCGREVAKLDCFLELAGDVSVPSCPACWAWCSVNERVRLWEKINELEERVADAGIRNLREDVEIIKKRLFGRVVTDVRWDEKTATLHVDKAGH